MSFILDALKKSETDRQRQNGPALFEVRMAPPKTGLPLWAIGLGGLLAVNLVIVAWVLLRKPSTPDAAGTPVAGQAQAANPQAPGYGAQQGYPGQQGYAPQGSYPQGQGYAGQPGYPGQPQGYAGAPQGYAGGPSNGQGYPQQQPQGYPPNGQGQQGYPPGYSGQPPYGGPNGAPNGYPQGQPVSGSPPGGPVGQTAGMPLSAQNGAQGAPGAAGQGDSDNPDDYAPAADPGPAKPFKPGVTQQTSAGVPLYRDAAALPGVNIPQLRLDLHVFAAKPQERFVMINMHKLHEGDLMPEGVRVEAITPDGAILSKDGVKFLLSQN